MMPNIDTITINQTESSNFIKRVNLLDYKKMMKNNTPVDKDPFEADRRIENKTPLSTY